MPLDRAFESFCRSAGSLAIAVHRPVFEAPVTQAEDPVSAEVRAMFTAHFSLKAQEFDFKKPISEYGADSLDFVDLIIDAEETFRISIEDERARAITNAHELIDCIKAIKNKR